MMKAKTILCPLLVLVVAPVIAYMTFAKMTAKNDAETNQFESKSFILFEKEHKDYREEFLLYISDNELAERDLTKEDVVAFVDGLFELVVLAIVDAISEIFSDESSNGSIEATPVELDDNKIKALNQLFEEGVPYEIRTYDRDGELINSESGIFQMDHDGMESGSGDV